MGGFETYRGFICNWIMLVLSALVRGRFWGPDYKGELCGGRNASGKNLTERGLTFGENGAIL